MGTEINLALGVLQIEPIAYQDSSILFYMLITNSVIFG